MPHAHRVRVIVHGRVQGVWFRASTQDTARLLGLAGWVRNRADGAVEAVFEGTREAIDRAVAWCRVGPERAAVDLVETYDEPAEGLRGFRVVG